MSTDETNTTRLLRRAERDSSSLVDTLVTAAEAAKAVVDADQARDTKVLVQALNDVLPAEKSVLERGLAIGMAFALMAVENDQ